MEQFLYSGAILLFFIGLVSIVGSCFYNKKEHKKFSKSSPSVSTGSFLGDILGFIVVGLLSIFPWYINKILMIGFGGLFFYFAYLAYIGY